MTALLRLPVVEFHVRGVAAPQGSKRYLGPGRAVESSKRLPTWRADVRDAATAAMLDRAPYDGPVIVELTFMSERPKSHYRTGRNGHLLRDGSPDVPVGAPDVDKLARAMLDAMSKIVYLDDKQVVELNARKRYVDDSSAFPGGVFVLVHPW